MKMAWVLPIKNGYADLEAVLVPDSMKENAIVKYKRENGTSSIGQVRIVSDMRDVSAAELLSIYKEEPIDD